MSYLEEQIRRLVGKAITQYKLISPNEKILVGLSGIDSIVMYIALSERLKRVPVNYELLPVYVDLGFDHDYTKSFLSLLSELLIPCHVIESNIGSIAHSKLNRENPCFLCAWNRRKILFNYASDVGANKIALGHHRDDTIVTFLMGLFYSAQVSFIYPRQEFFGGRLTIIRPLFLVSQEAIDAYAKKKGLSLPTYPCPSYGKTKRKEVELLLELLSRKNRNIKGNIFTAIKKLVEG